MATLTYNSGAAYQGNRAVFSDATGTPDGHALVARAVVSLNALDEVRAILTRIAACWEQDCTCGAREARAGLALLGPERPYDLCINTPCPTCGAVPGEFCTVYMAGGVREVPHKTRTGR